MTDQRRWSPAGPLWSAPLLSTWWIPACPDRTASLFLASMVEQIPAHTSTISKSNLNSSITRPHRNTHQNTCTANDLCTVDPCFGMKAYKRTILVTFTVFSRWTVQTNFNLSQDKIMIFIKWFLLPLRHQSSVLNGGSLLVCNGEWWYCMGFSMMMNDIVMNNGVWVWIMFCDGSFW